MDPARAAAGEEEGREPRSPRSRSPSPSPSPRLLESPSPPAPSPRSPPPSPPAPSPPASLAGSGGSWMSVSFQSSHEEERFRRVCRALALIGYVYLFTASCSFFSSLYPVRAEAEAAAATSVDAFLVTSNIIAIDLCSALFVICGFVAAYTHANMTAADWCEFAKIVSLYVLVDLWLSTCGTLVIGSIFHLAKHSFRFQDAALTCVNGLTGVRVFEFRQDRRAWHDMNPTAWVVPSLMYCLLLLPLSTRTNQRLRALWSGGGDFLALANAVLPIVVIGLFALVRDDTNVFFANSANLGYRLFEFNLGTCLYTLTVREGSARRVLCKVFAVLQRVALPVYFLFVMIWWSELGAKAPPSAEQVCVRMYYFSPCIQVHHAFLMRGCLLGMTFIATVLEVPPPGPHLPSARRPAPNEQLAPVLSAVLFVWPTCYAVELMLELNFSTVLAHDHAMLLVFVVPHIALGLAFLWEETGKKRAFAVCENLLCVVVARYAAWWSGSRLRAWRGGGD